MSLGLISSLRPVAVLAWALCVGVCACVCDPVLRTAKRDVSVAQWMQDISKEVNSDESSTWFAASDSPADAGEEERREPRVRPWLYQEPIAQYDNEVDWRTSGVLRRPETQGRCGSCWAFATTHTVNDRLNIEQKKANRSPTSPMSVQHTVECTCRHNPRYCGRLGSDGCAGVLDATAGSNFLRLYGTPETQCKKYLGIDHGKACRTQCDNGSYISQSGLTHLVDYQTISSRYSPKYTVERMKRALRQGPIIATIMMRTDFLRYRSGVYSASKRSTLVGGHQIEIVGSGNRRVPGKTSVPYWIIKNSWGSEWGHNGYAYVRAGTNELRIETRGVVVPYVSQAQRRVLSRRQRMGRPRSWRFGVCQRLPFTKSELTGQMYKQVMDFLDSVAVDRHDVLPGCNEHRQYRRKLLNGTHQVADAYLYNLTVEYSSPLCPGQKRVFHGEVSLGFDTARYFLIRGNVLHSVGRKCVCLPSGQARTSRRQPAHSQLSDYWALFRAAARALL